MRELLARISSRELSEWMAYYELEPWGEERADLRAGIIASAMANVWGAKTKPADFMPNFDNEEMRVESTELLRAKLEMFARAQNRKVKGK